jgi:hypothetical protein
LVTKIIILFNIKNNIYIKINLCFMAILIKETKFSQLSIPETGYVLFGLDSETGNVKYIDSTGESQTISVDTGAEITGGSVVVGELLSDATVGTKILANGYNVTATGNYSHPEGNQTIALGNWSHAEGYKTTASFDYAHSQGKYTTAGGEASLTGGIGTASYLVIASGSASVNISSTNSRTSDITGANSVILGGIDNLIGSSSSSAIIGGMLNTINGISNNGVFVGVSNTINNSSQNCVILGGSSNTIYNSSQNSIILGGSTNNINNAGICDVIIASTSSTIASSLSYVSIIGMSGYAATAYSNVVYMPSIALVNSSAAPTVNGAIRYNGTTFQGYKGSWVSLERPTDYVDISTTQSVSGAKTWSSAAIFSSTATFNSSAIFNSNMTIGGSSSDALTINSTMTFPVNTAVIKNQVVYSFTTGADVTTEQIISRTYHYICVNIDITNTHVDVIYNIELDSFESSTTTISSILLVNIDSNGWGYATATLNFRDTANNVLKTYNIPAFTGGVEFAAFTIGYVAGGTLSNRFIISGNI